MGTAFVVACLALICVRAPKSVPWRASADVRDSAAAVYVIDDGSRSPYAPRPNVLAIGLGRAARLCRLDRLGAAEYLLSAACLSCAAGIVHYLWRAGWLARWSGY
jgi:hypothetical protein